MSQVSADGGVALRVKSERFLNADPHEDRAGRSHCRGRIRYRNSRSSRSCWKIWLHQSKPFPRLTPPEEKCLSLLHWMILAVWLSAKVRGCNFNGDTLLLYNRSWLWRLAKRTSLTQRLISRQITSFKIRGNVSITLLWNIKANHKIAFNSSILIKLPLSGVNCACYQHPLLIEQYAPTVCLLPHSLVCAMLFWLQRKSKMRKRNQCHEWVNGWRTTAFQGKKNLGYEIFNSPNVSEQTRAVKAVFHSFWKKGATGTKLNLAKTSSRVSISDRIHIDSRSVYYRHWQFTLCWSIQRKMTLTGMNDWEILQLLKGWRWWLILSESILHGRGNYNSLLQW